MYKILFFLIIFFFFFFSPINFSLDKIILKLEGKQEESYIPKRKMVLTQKQPILPQSKLLDVPLYNQMDQPRLKNGCEVTSLAMLLNFHGIKVTKNNLADKIKTVPILYGNNKRGNPNIGFVGDMANGTGLSVYNGPIFDLAKEYLGKKVINLTNSPFEDLLRKVGRGLPVWVITTRDFDSNVNFVKWETIQGTIYITYREHSAVITGYDSKYIYVNDPYGYKNRKVDKKEFINAWEIMGSQAIVIEK